MKLRALLVTCVIIFLLGCHVSPKRDAEIAHVSYGTLKASLDGVYDLQAMLRSGALSSSTSPSEDKIKQTQNAIRNAEKTPGISPLLLSFWSAGITALSARGPREAAQPYLTLLQKQDPLNLDAYVMAHAFLESEGKSSALSTDFANGRYLGKILYYEHLFQNVKQIISSPLPLKPTILSPKEQTKSAIVILGFGLTPQGQMKARLYMRLAFGIQEAHLNPLAQIIVSGGHSQSGVTEAYRMRQYLVYREIPAQRITLESHSQDTVSNGLETLKILKREDVHSIILVTSAFHMRRALAVFSQEALTASYPLYIYGFSSYLNKQDLDKARTGLTPRERFKIYRDVVRASGLALFPGFMA